MFLDHFSNGSVDLKQNTNWGTITEPAGTQLRLYIPDGVNAPINPVAAGQGCPIAWGPTGVLAKQSINGPWIFDAKLDQLTNGNNNVICGMMVWQGDVEDIYSTATVYEIGYYPAESAIVLHRYLGSWSGTRLATSGQTKPNGTSVQHIYRIVVNPLDRRVPLTDVGIWAGADSYINPNTIGFAFSVNGGSTWTWWHTRTIEFDIDGIGLHIRNWSSAGGVTHEGLFDYYAIASYEWDAKTRIFVPSIPAQPSGDLRTIDPRTHTSMEDEVNLLRGGGGQTDQVILNQDRGAFLPGPVDGPGEHSRERPDTLSMEDQVRVITYPQDETHVLLPGALQQREMGAHPDAQSAEDEAALLNQKGLSTFFSLPELQEPFLLPRDAGRQVMGAEDELLWDLQGADYQDDKLDGDGNELLYSVYNVQAVQFVDNTVGTFGNPGTGHYGAAKDGKFYFNGVECSGASPSFGTVLGGPNRTAWPWWSGTDPFAKDLPAGSSFTIPSDGAIQFQGTALNNGDGAVVSSRNGWHFVGGVDFDIQIDFSGLTWSGGTDGGTPMLTVLADPYNLFYVRRQGTVYDKNAHIGGSGQSYSSVATAATSGKLRVTRTGTTMAAFYWNGASWTQIGANYSHASFGGVMYVAVSVWGSGGRTVDVVASNFTINSGATDNTANWFREASGAHRGTKQAMPDHMAIVATQQSVDLIDTDTDKLWMRFVKNTNNALHYFSAQSQYVRDLAWDNGKLILAHGSSPSATEEGGTIMIDFSTELIRTTRESISSVTGGTYATYANYATYAYPPGLWGITARNSNSTYVNDYDDWQIQDYRVYATAIRHNGFDEFIASGTLLGLTIHKLRRWHVSQTNRDYNWPQRSVSSETSEIKFCGFRSDDVVFYADDTNLYSRDRTNGSNTGWEDVMDAGTFSAEKTEALPGSRSLRAQYRPLFYGNYVFIPANEGVYRIDWTSGSWVLFYGVGGTHDILQPYTRVNSISLANDGTYDLLVVSLETTTESRINVVKLVDNSLYGVTAPTLNVNAVQAVAS